MGLNISLKHIRQRLNKSMCFALCWLLYSHQASLHFCLVTGIIVHCEPENIVVTTLPGYYLSICRFISILISYFFSESLLTVLFVNITEELEMYMEVYCRRHYMA
jgi:hypothetical protein